MRRTPPVRADAAIDGIVYARLDWPGKTVRLDPDSSQLFIQRPSSGSSSIAEVYHLNSSLGPATASRLLASRTDIPAFRREAIERSALAVARAGADERSAPDRLVKLLQSTRDLAGIDLFFALELRVIHNQALFAFEPVSGRLSMLALLPERHLAGVESGLRILESTSADLRAAEAVTEHPFEALAVIIGRFGRHEVLYGPRGYRRTLIEAGRLCGHLLRVCADEAVDARLITEFSDDQLDGAVLADGLEDGCVAVVRIGAKAQ